MTSAAPATESVLPIPAPTEHPGETLEQGTTNNASAWTGGGNTLILQKQELKDEFEKVLDSESNIQQAETKGTTEDATAIHNTPGLASTVDDEIDSALLAALRDPRERLPLLKLEQVLIDFLDKQPQDRYIDVGGPYNSIVVSPSLGHIGNLEEAMQFSNAAGGNVKGNNYVRPQSTFQRCILHRLCDRFHMTRVKSYVDEGFGYYIRVVKGSDSGMPPRLLLNVQPSEYALTMHESTSMGSLTASLDQLGVSGGGAAASDGTGGAASVPPSGIPLTTTTKSSKPRKMKIMKRSSNSNASASGGDNNSRKSSKKEAVKRNSSLSEKERKYAEARARIFETEESAEEHFAPISTKPPVNDPPANRTSPNTDSANRAHSNSSSRSSTPSHTGLNHTPPRTGSGGNLEGGTSANNKATYRNRHQEEADPDFRRGARMVVTPQPVEGWNGGGPGATPFYPQNAAGRGYYGQQKPHQEQQQQYQYGVHPQHQQQYHQQYFVAAAPQGVAHHSRTANVAILPGMQPGAVYQQAAHYGQGVPMATGSANVAKTPNAAVTTAAPVDMTRREQFPALR